MTVRRLALGVVCLAAIGALAAAYVRYVREAEARLDPGDLMRRAALSNPDWANYQEDIKAQIGAAPVAQWRGHPVAVRREGALIHVTFRLEGPWAERAMVIPVLLRDPFGNETRHRGYEFTAPDVVYTFQLADEAARAPLPWVMVKYPHHEDRLPLDSDGEWTANSGD